MEAARSIGIGLLHMVFCGNPLDCGQVTTDVYINFLSYLNTQLWLKTPVTCVFRVSIVATYLQVGEDMVETRTNSVAIARVLPLGWVAQGVVAHHT